MIPTSHNDLNAFDGDRIAYVYPNDPTVTEGLQFPGPPADIVTFPKSLAAFRMTRIMKDGRIHMIGIDQVGGVWVAMNRGDGTFAAPKYVATYGKPILNASLVQEYDPIGMNDFNLAAVLTDGSLQSVHQLPSGVFEVKELTPGVRFLDATQLVAGRLQGRTGDDLALIRPWKGDHALTILQSRIGMTG
jgi:hypothetical protein